MQAFDKHNVTVDFTSWAMQQQQQQQIVTFVRNTSPEIIHSAILLKKKRRKNNITSNDVDGKRRKGQFPWLIHAEQIFIVRFWVCASMLPFFRWLVLRLQFSTFDNNMFVCLYFIGSMGEILRAFAHGKKARLWCAKMMGERWSEVCGSAPIYTHTIHPMHRSV